MAEMLPKSLWFSLGVILLLFGGAVRSEEGSVEIALPDGGA